MLKHFGAKQLINNPSAAAIYLVTRQDDFKKLCDRLMNEAEPSEMSNGLRTEIAVGVWLYLYNSHGGAAVATPHVLAGELGVEDPNAIVFPDVVCACAYILAKYW